MSQRKIALLRPSTFLTRLTIFSAATVALLAVSISCGGDKKDEGSATTPTRIAQAGIDAPPTPAPSVPASPTAAVAAVAPLPPPENRADCNAIRGTDYRSPEERDWFVQNCGAGSSSAFTGGTSSAGAAVVGNQTPTGDRIIISKAGVNADVYRTAVPASGAMPDPWGYYNAVSYDFSRLPGFGGDVNPGNLIMSGHVDCARCNNGGSGTAVFWGIRNLSVGDTAQYRTADGRTINYVVTSSRSLSPSANWDSIAASGAADMTLITCTGTFSGGEYNLRHVVAFSKV